MIINIRGTHGSGKSTIIRKILDAHDHQELWTQSTETPEDEALLGGPAKQKLLGYKVDLGLRKKLYVVGPYRTACGGCDAIQPYDLIWPRVEAYARAGHVIFEGALVSSSVGNIGRAMAARKDCVVAFMDTPVEECLRRIEARRKARGDDRPLNPKNTVNKHRAVANSRPKLEALGLKCITVPHKKALSCIMGCLQNGKR